MKDLKNLWMYTGYRLEEIQSSQNNDMIELLHYGDVLVDGRFEIEKRFNTSISRKLQSTYYSIERVKGGIDYYE